MEGAVEDILCPVAVFNLYVLKQNKISSTLIVGIRWHQLYRTQNPMWSGSQMENGENFFFPVS